jgi:hypothetical protein
VKTYDVIVLGLEQYTAAHDRGSSHGGSRMIRFTLYREQARRDGAVAILRQL